MTFLIGTPHAKGAGYFLNDNTASGGGKAEGDVQTCKHCQRVLIMQQWQDSGGWCGRCGAPICGPCADRMDRHGCEPFIAQIERAANMTSKLAHYRKLAGLDPPEPPRPLITGTEGISHA